MGNITHQLTLPSPFLLQNPPEALSLQSGGELEHTLLPLIQVNTHWPKASGDSPPSLPGDPDGTTGEACGALITTDESRKLGLLF